MESRLYSSSEVIIFLFQEQVLNTYRAIVHEVQGKLNSTNLLMNGRKMVLET